MNKSTDNKNTTNAQLAYNRMLANRKARDKESLKHKYFRRTELNWVRRRDGYKFDNEECGLSIDHYLETGQEP